MILRNLLQTLSEKLEGLSSPKTQSATQFSYDKQDTSIKVSAYSPAHGFTDCIGQPVVVQCRKGRDQRTFITRLRLVLSHLYCSTLETCYRDTSDRGNGTRHTTQLLSTSAPTTLDDRDATGKLETAYQWLHSAFSVRRRVALHSFFPLCNWHH